MSTSTAEPRTQREILAALHMPVPDRNCCTDLLDDNGGRGFGIRHLTLVIVTFTFSVMCLSIFRSGSATRSVGGGNGRQGGTAVSNVAPAGLDDDNAGLPLHYVNLESSTMLVYPATVLSDPNTSLIGIEAAAAKAAANLVAFVGTHTPEDTSVLIKHLEQRPTRTATKLSGSSSNVQYILSVPEEGKGEPISHESVFSDTTYFSVISKAFGYEVMSARNTRVANPTSAIQTRLRRTPFSHLVLLTESKVALEDFKLMPEATQQRLVTAHAAGAQVVLRSASAVASVSRARDVVCAVGIITVDGNGQKYQCL